MADLFVGVERSESAQIQQTDFGGAVLLGRQSAPVSGRCHLNRPAGLTFRLRRKFTHSAGHCQRQARDGRFTRHTGTVQTIDIGMPFAGLKLESQIDGLSTNRRRRCYCLTGSILMEATKGLLRSNSA